MIDRLKQSLKEMDNIMAMQKDVTDDLIKKLPKDKRKEARNLMNGAKSGKLSIADIMKFTGKVSEKDEKDLKKRMNDLNRE